MNSRNSYYAWLKIILSLQIFVGITCGFLSFREINFKGALHDFAAHEARIEKDLRIVSPLSEEKPNNYLILGTKEEMESLQDAGLALSWLVFVCSTCLIGFSMIALYMIRVIVKSKDESQFHQALQPS